MLEALLGLFGWNSIERDLKKTDEKLTRLQWRMDAVRNDCNLSAEGKEKELRKLQDGVTLAKLARASLKKKQNQLDGAVVVR